MLFRTPEDHAIDRELRELDELRARLGDSTGAAGPWLGTLRRQVRAASAASSIAIEGFRVPQAETVALATGARQPDLDDDDRMALACYGRAMDHVGTLAVDPRFRWLDRVILDLHFDTCWFQREARPGLYREGGIAVTSLTGAGHAYVGPPAEDVPALMDELVAWLEEGDLDAHVVVRAAMAHLHLVSIHPFGDGNGRISRILQSLVLARERRVAPEFGSIEEHLRQHTGAYYATLQEVQGGSYRPERDAMAWVRFCVRAHLAQARARLTQIEHASARWSHLEELVEARGWPDRLVIALEQTLFGAADRAAYAQEAGVSPATASADFRRLVDAGLVVQHGMGRATRYLATDALRDGVGRALRDS